MRKLDPKFIEMTKEFYPDDWEERVKRFETDETLQKVVDYISETFGVQSPYVTEEPKQEEPIYDPVDHPKHYVEQSATIEPIEVLRFAPFDLGNALKYMIRAGHKENELEDLKKAEWYLECASKTYWVNSKPYDTFFNRYGFILEKFEAMPANLINDMDDPIDVLLDIVRERIANFEGQDQ